MLFKKPENILFEKPEDLFKYVSGGIAAPTKKNFKKVISDYQNISHYRDNKSNDSYIQYYHDGSSNDANSNGIFGETVTGSNGIEFKSKMIIDKSNDDVNNDVKYLSALYAIERKKDLTHLAIFGTVSTILIASLIKSSKDKCEICEDEYEEI